MSATSTLSTFRVTDLKQYAYCPRILYYHAILPQVRPTTYKMAAGVAAHQEIEKREKRRLLRTYGLQKGERIFNVSLFDEELGLSGEIDLLIETAAELIPVDYKNSNREGHHYRLQLMAYARLLERNYPGRVEAIRRGFIYLIPKRKAIEVPFTSGLRRQLSAALEIMQKIAHKE
ncbi:MAG: CRISPR-associated protein Cas4, partial [Anaerolineae bacterium]